MLITAGALTGFIVGLTGVGGGALMTPLLLLVFGVAPPTAVGTDLWFAAITKLAIAPIHQKAGLIDWGVLRLMWAGSLSASAATLIWMRMQPVDAHGASLLRAAIAVGVCLTSVTVLSQKGLHTLGWRFGLSSPETRNRYQAPLTIAAGGLLGALVTLTSIGAGALGVVLLLYLYPSRLTPPRLIATDIAHAIPLAIFAGLGHLLISNVDFALLRNLLIGSIPAAILGATLSSRLTHGRLRVALALVLLVVGIKMMGDAF